MLDYWGWSLPASPDTAMSVAATLPRLTVVEAQEMRVPSPSKYESIAADLRARIASGEYPPGSVLPGYEPLGKAYSASRGTVEKAIRALQTEGLVEIRHGAGTFVRSFAPIVRAGQRRVSQEVWGNGRSPWEIDAADRRAVVTNLHTGPMPVPFQFAGPLDLPFDAEVFSRRRTYVIEDRPVMVATSYLPRALTKDTRIEDENPGPGGIYARLAEAGHGPVRFAEQVRSRPPSAEEVAALRLVAGTYVLHIVRVAFASGGRPVEVADMVADPTVYVLEYEFDA